KVAQKVWPTVLPVIGDRQGKVEGDIALSALLHELSLVLAAASALDAEVDACWRLDQDQPDRNFSVHASQKRVGVIGGPLSKSARRPADDIGHGGGHQRGASHRGAPRVQQHVDDWKWPAAFRLPTELFG